MNTTELKRTLEFVASRTLDAPAMDALVSMASLRSLQAGECLFREGDRSAFWFVVASGALQVQKQTEDGRAIALRSLEPGAVGGLTSVFSDETRSATLLAQGPTTLWIFSRDAFLSLLTEHPSLARGFLTHLGEKVRAKTQQVASLTARAGRDARELIAFFDAKSYERNAFASNLGDDLRVRYFEARLGPSTASLARGYPVVCVFVNDELHASVLETLHQGGTTLVALRCAGFNNVDLAAAKRLGIEVVRVPAYSPYAVAEHTAALLMALNRKTHRAYNRVREGNFSLHNLVGFDLHGRIAGLVGLGKIGRCFASILRGFGMRVLAYEPSPDEDFVRSNGIELVSLEALLAQADVVSLHVPLNKQTYHLINEERLAQMKRGVFLLNTSRGGLIDTVALIEGLKNGHIGAAGLDVYEEESEYFFSDHSDHPIDDDVLARLMTFPNVLVTSHQAFLTTDALDNIAGITMENIRQFLRGARGEALTNRVLERFPGGSI